MPDSVYSYVSFLCYMQAVASSVSLGHIPHLFYNVLYVIWKRWHLLCPTDTFLICFIIYTSESLPLLKKKSVVSEHLWYIIILDCCCYCRKYMLVIWPFYWEFDKSCNITLLLKIFGFKNLGILKLLNLFSSWTPKEKLLFLFCLKINLKVSTLKSFSISSIDNCKILSREQWPQILFSTSAKNKKPIKS